MKTHFTSALITRFYTALIVAGSLCGLMACGDGQEPVPASPQTLVGPPQLPNRNVPGEGNQKQEDPPTVSRPVAAQAVQPVNDGARKTYQSARKAML